MWKTNKEEVPAKPSAPNPTYTGIPAKEVRPVDVTKPFEARSDMAHIGKSVLVKGELSGSEDLYLDGEVEGTIELQRSALTIGPNGKIRAHVNAREVIVHGKVDGNLSATDKVELKRTAILVGDIKTQRITIEDGAYFKGSIDIQREAKSEPKKETPAVSTAVAAPASSGVTPQGSFADKK
ncbi:MAG TPA: polymer-forming cytoskeletal protein [Terriglobales bacterium]|nr:polymer-forming cytoskeletal protein [Terriglobales bacterium]